MCTRARLCVSGVTNKCCIENSNYLKGSRPVFTEATLGVTYFVLQGNSAISKNKGTDFPGGKILFQIPHLKILQRQVDVASVDNLVQPKTVANLSH